MKASKSVGNSWTEFKFIRRAEPGVYGDQSFENVNKSIIEKAEKLNVE